MDQQLTPQEKAQVAQVTQELLSKQTPQGSSQAFVPKVIKDQGVISAREWSNMPTQEKAYCISLALCAEIICGKKSAQRAHQASKVKGMQGFDDMDAGFDDEGFDVDSEGLGDLKFISSNIKRQKIRDEADIRLKNEQDSVFKEREKFLALQTANDYQLLDESSKSETVYDSKGNSGVFVSNKLLESLGIPKTINRYKNYVIRTKIVQRRTPEKTFMELSVNDRFKKLRFFGLNLANRARDTSAMVFFLADAIDSVESKINRIEALENLTEATPAVNLSSHDISEGSRIQLEKDIFCLQHYLNALYNGTANPAEINPMNENKPDVTDRTGLLNGSSNLALFVLCQLITGDFKKAKIPKNGKVQVLVLPEMVQRLAGKVIRSICHPQITNAMVHANNLGRNEYKAFVYPLATNQIVQAAITQTNAGGQIGLRR